MVLEFKFPDVGEGITEGKLVSWKVKVGDVIKVDSPICDVETDKATVDIPSPANGKVIELIGNPSDTLNVGDVIMKIDTTNESDGEKQKEIGDESDIEIKEKVEIKEKTIEEKPVEKEVKPEETIKVQENDNKVYDKNFSLDVLAMPYVREEAKKNNIDLSSVKASGVHGEVTINDLNGGSKISENENKLNSENIENKNNEDNSKNNNVNKDNNKVEINESNLKIGEIEEEKGNSKEKENLNTNSPNENVDEIDVSDIAKAQEEKEKEKNLKPKEIIATPSVRQLARDLDIDINFILGSGEGGKIIEDDIKRAKELKDKFKGGIKSQLKQPIENNNNNNNSIENEKDSAKEIPNENVNEVNLKDEKKINENSHMLQSNSLESTSSDVRIPIQGIRKIISERMTESLSKTAQVTICDEANITEIVNLRNREKNRLLEKGIKLNYIPFFIKAFIETSKEFNKFNAIVDDSKNEILLKSNFNIGIAVDTNKGLLVPVIQMCEHKSIIDMSKEIVELSSLAREGKLNIEQMKGSSFTISSVGNLGGQFFTPIINYPQVAILGVGRIVKKPTIRDSDGDMQIVIGDVISFSLTFDHRVIDGATAAKFLKKFIELIENPEELMLNLE